MLSFFLNGNLQVFVVVEEIVVVVVLVLALQQVFSLHDLMHVVQQPYVVEVP